MGAKKKIPIYEVKRNNERYTFFDNHKLSVFEKSYFLEEAIKSHLHNFKYEEKKVQEKKEFINKNNYDFFIKDLKALITIMDENKNLKMVRDNKCLTPNDIMEEVYNLGWNVDKIEKYLSEIIYGSREDTVLSFMHPESFTKTIISYPYDRVSNQGYQKHTRHLVEIDFKQPIEDIHRYIDSLKDMVERTHTRNKYETHTNKQNIFNSKLNFGDFLFTHDCKKSNCTISYTVDEINVFREFEQEILQKTTQKQISTYLKKMNELNYDLDLFIKLEDIESEPIEICITLVGEDGNDSETIKIKSNESIYRA